MVSHLDDIAAQLRHYTLEEVIALVGDFLAELDEQQQARFLELVTHGPRPLVAEAMGLEDREDLLASIQALRDDLANDVYVRRASATTRSISHRGFGDDSWIDEMDDLFAAADSLYRAGQFPVAVEAYLALFGIFRLGEDGFHFTRPTRRRRCAPTSMHQGATVHRDQPERPECGHRRRSTCRGGCGTTAADAMRLLDAWAARS